MLTATIRDIVYALNGKRRYKLQELELQYKMQKEHGRWQLTFLHNMLADKKDHISDPKKLVTFSWEEEYREQEESKIMSQQAKEALLKRIERYN